MGAEARGDRGQSSRVWSMAGLDSWPEDCPRSILQGGPSLPPRPRTPIPVVNYSKEYTSWKTEKMGPVKDVRGKAGISFLAKRRRGGRGAVVVNGRLEGGRLVYGQGRKNNTTIEVKQMWKVGMLELHNDAVNM
ncbi:hypothetical protein RRG08_055334 [Elysia crispata]|uniref:Uncharacterized protein n=1 Tax=Elysia crispata TaxID=231223 RepID=A0AAE1AQA8_9GAST|nr:hypothetical protein RRG08_055334 [Elysia crispata]